MPRNPVLPGLPRLDVCLPDFSGLVAGTAKSRQIADTLRPVIARHRQSRSQPFHTSREIGRFFGVCQQTATHAVGLLEKEGIIRRIRGSHTVMTGSKNVTRVPIRAVAGFPLGFVQSRYSYPHKRLSRDLGDDLWRHHIALETISYVEIGGNLPDFVQRLHRHGINFCIWLTPLTHNRAAMLHLADQGVRNLVVDFNARTAGFKTDVVIDIMRSYVKVARQWRDKHAIKRILVIEPSEYAQERIASFVPIMVQHGFDCRVLKSTPTLAGEIETAHRDGPPIGIALLDERATAEFIFYEPAAFVAIARRHRVLCGNNYTEVPFAGNGETLVDRISIDHINLTHVISATLVRWLNHDFSDQPHTVTTWPGFDVPLWRYL